jgi:replicative DNA helicase
MQKSKGTDKSEKNLADYQGEDRIVTSYELKATLSNIQSEPFTNALSGINGIDFACEGFRDGELIVISGPTKNGKCMKKGTKLICYDGSIKNIENIKVGDLLMGDDSTPRRVLSTCSGIDELFKIIPWQGDSYSVNKEHILCLERCQTTNRKTDNLANTITEISVQDYLKLSKTQKHIHKTYRVPVEFKEKEVPCSPYILGLWLGDGHSHTPTITTADKEIVEYLEDFCLLYNFRFSVKKDKRSEAKDCRICGKNQGENKFLDFLKHYDLLGNKHIPDDYKINSEENRLLLLAGLIDTDGNYVKSTRGGAIEFVSKSKNLIDDVAFLARSLGFSCTPHKVTKTIKSINFSGEYWTMRIAGDTSRIPCLLERKTRNGMKPFKRHLRSSFKIEPNGVGEYFGFVLDGNGRYLLADFQVTHNTLLAQTMTINFAHKNIFSTWFSFEVPPRQFLSQFPALPLIHMPLKLKPKDIEWFKDRVLESYQKYNTRIVFIDHLHYLVDMVQRNNLSIEIGAIIRELKTFAVANNFVIFLLCHTTKPKTDAQMSYADIRDSSFISQESDCCLMVKRMPHIAENAAKISIEYHRRTGVMERVISVVKEGGVIRESINEGGYGYDD